MKGAEPMDLVQHNYRRNGRQNASNSSFLEAKYSKFRFSVVCYLNSKTTDKETCKENVNNSYRKKKAGKGNCKRRDEKVKPLLPIPREAAQHNWESATRKTESRPFK